jgi:hypothetical protein
LKAPHFWNVSHLKYSLAPLSWSRVALVSTGVVLMRPAMRAWACCISGQVRGEICSDMVWPSMATPAHPGQAFSA